MEIANPARQAGPPGGKSDAEAWKAGRATSLTAATAEQATPAQLRLVHLFRHDLGQGTVNPLFQILLRYRSQERRP